MDEYRYIGFYKGFLGYFLYKFINKTTVIEGVNND